MIPAKKDLEFYPGDSFTFFFRVFRTTTEGIKSYPVLEGTPAGHVKAARGAEEPVLAAFTCTLGDQVAYPGSILCTLTPEQTADLGEKNFYDVQLTVSPTDIRTYVTGSLDRHMEEVTAS